MRTQADRDALAAEIRSWRRRADSPYSPNTRAAVGAFHLLGDDWLACRNAARALRGLATAFPADPADRAARIALARAVAAAAFRGELAPDFAAARDITRVMRARRA